MTLQWNSLSSFKSSHIFGKLYYFCMHVPSAISMFSAIFVLCLYLFHHEVLYIFFLLFLLFISTSCLFFSFSYLSQVFRSFYSLKTLRTKQPKNGKREKRTHTRQGFMQNSVCGKFFLISSETRYSLVCEMSQIYPNA